ncbi:hypothetical protein, partial [Secundilactobacillus odoratitofui]|uniref:hypothetical protein n=1 Tax=Secundilactobacillus odoratitofui TaxID=480930 RepID=UPI000ADB59F2
IAGYTPVGTGIAQNMPAPTTTEPQADNETIEYKADSQTIAVNYVDDEGSTTTPVATDTVSGDTGTTVT